jgi:hypothetical protein
LGEHTALLTAGGFGIQRLHAFQIRIARSVTLISSSVGMLSLPSVTFVAVGAGITPCASASEPDVRLSPHPAPFSESLSRHQFPSLECIISVP